MRFTLGFSSNSNELPIDYRRKFIHFFKHALSTYDQTLLEKVYQTNNMKRFTFSVYFVSPTYTADKVTFAKDSKVQVTLSVESPALAMEFCGAIMAQRFIPIKSDNTILTLHTIRYVKETNITSSRILVRFMSPLVIQKHENDKDWFYGYQQDGFQEMAETIISKELAGVKYSGPGRDVGVKIFPSKAKKLVVRHYEKQIECSSGEFILIGHPAVLQFLYGVGVGSKRSSGFGMFEVVQQGDAAK